MGHGFIPYPECAAFSNKIIKLFTLFMELLRACLLPLKKKWSINYSDHENYVKSCLSLKAG